MKAQIAFRPLAVEDLQQVFLWLGRPHVTKWYAPAPSSFAEVVAKYSPRTEAGNAVRAFIVTVDGNDAGYIQTYATREFPDYAARLACDASAASVDLFIGDAWRMNHGLGSAVVRRFVEEVVFADASVRSCLAGPGEGDAAAIRAFEKAGFARWKTVKLEDGGSEWVMRLERDAPPFRIAPIDLARDHAVCIAFRRDAYVATFGSGTGMDDEMGADNAIYLRQLRERIAQVPEGNAHLWHAGRIVGQTEMRFVDADPGMGYVNLFYVLPEFRGQGLGRLLHEHAAAVFRAHGRRAMRLSVSDQNTAAIAFYRRLGWVTVGTRPNREPMQIMEFSL